jgi:hypothetical protein
MTCLTPGARIATPRGERLIETLKPGDRVITRLNGIRPLRWIGQRDLGGRELVLGHHLRPILIRAGSFGRGRPESDILASPNMRFRVPGHMPIMPTSDTEVVAAAKHLVGCPGIHEVQPLRVTYILPIFDTYEEILVNGCWTEAFHPSEALVRPGGNAQRTEMHELFPDHAPPVGYTVRPPRVAEPLAME